ncbi:MotA/TolQ/ExbB proton channel family protein [Pseudodesulfovibrio cashew]|nr:MotA/TolQ/ExbB proton channel family protein [Pseudodesulfovibrio cashew]
MTGLRPVLVLFMLVLLSLPHPAGAAESASTGAAERLNKLAESMDERTAALERMLSLDRAELRARVAALRKTMADETARLDKRTAELAALRKEREAKERQYDEAAADMRSVEDAVRANAAQARTLLEDSAVTSLRPGRLAPLERIAASEAFPGLNEISSLAALLLEEIQRGGSAETLSGDFLGPNGLSRHGTLLRGGSLFLGATDGSDAFLLKPGSTPPTAVASTPSGAESAIAAWAERDGSELPLDPAHGAALSLLQARRTVDDWLQGGGMLLWPILAAGLLAGLAIVYKSVRLLALRPAPVDFTASLRAAVDKGGWPDVEELLRSMPRVPAARVLLKTGPEAGTELRDKQLQEGFLTELRRMESLLGFIAVMAAVAPLLGLLGTVTGMIDSFQAVTIFGTSNPRIMSGGISEALITTQAGLGVAIPVMLLHHFLKQRVRTLAGDMEQQCAALLALLAGRKRKRHA